MEKWTRRKFFVTTLAGGVAAGARRLFGAEARQASAASPAQGVRPLIISAQRGLKHLDHGMAILKSGGDTLDAVLAVVTKVEDDPEDNTVGYGGLPNEDGVVELDASVMHGPTRRAGAVASVQKIKNPSLVAKVVMEKTNHVFIVGAGADKFAIDEGFQSMNLLTDKSRTAWLAWKAATTENWRPGLDSPEWKEKLAALLDTPEKREWKEWVEEVVAHPPTGTINCLAVDAKGDISGTTTTSGLAWKIAGRVGDSHHRRGPLRGQRYRCRWFDRPRGGEHQNLRRAHDCGDDAQGNVANGRVPGSAASRGAQLQALPGAAQDFSSALLCAEQERGLWLGEPLGKVGQR